MYKKRKSKLLSTTCGLLATVLILGGAGALTWGALTDWKFSTSIKEDEFKDVVIQDQSKVFTGEALTLDILVPEGAEYDVIIKNQEGSIVDEAIEIGDYTFEITVKIGDKEKVYTAILHITDSEVETSDIKEQGGMKLRLVSIQSLDNGDVVKTFSYTITPEDATNQSINVSVAWGNDGDSSTDDDTFKSGKTVTDYVSVNKDESLKQITVTCHQAFGSVIKVIVSSIDNPEATASVRVDYRKKRTYSINVTGHTIANNMSWNSYAKGTYSESVGTLSYNGESFNISMTGATVNSTLLALLDGYDDVIDALQTGQGSNVLTEVNQLSGKDYNAVVDALNSYKTNAVTFKLKYATISDYEFIAGYDLGSTSIKVEDIEISGDSNIIF